MALLLILSACLAQSVAADGDSLPEVRAVLRTDWNQASNATWDGTFHLSAGRIESIQILPLRSGQLGVLPQTDDNDVHFRSEGPAAWSGLEFVVHAPLQAQVELELDGHKLTAPFHELLEGATAQMDSVSEARLRRDVADIFPVRVSRTPLIFASGETVDFEIEFRLASSTLPMKTRFQVALRAARQGSWLFSREAELTVPTDLATPPRRTVTVRMPSDEGVYDLVIRAEPEGKRPVERLVQFVVFNASATAVPGSHELESRLVQEIDPAQPNGGERWYSTRRLRARTSRIGQFLWSSVRHPFAQPDHAKEAPLVSYRLNIDHPGRAHLISIDYEDCGNLLLAAALSETDPNGNWTQLPMTSGIRTDEKPQSTGVQSHQLICWPRTNQPTITLSVDGSAGLGSVKKVQVQEMPIGLPILQVSDSDSARRFFGLFLDSSDVWGSWSSGRVIDASPRLPIDDWCTFLDSMNHLAEYARFAGHNSMLVTVIGNGGALFPSTKLDVTRALDNGLLADTACDPVQKDVVELFARICQRHHLSFFPSIRFDGAIAAIDRELADADPQATGLLLVSRTGNVWDGLTGTRTVRRYNPLNPAVQSAMLEVIRELVDRYAARTSLEGLALDLAPYCHAVLPGLDWGYDDDTVERFRRDSGVDLPSDSVPDPERFVQRHQFLTTVAREQWVAWRCRQLSKFYEAILAELQRAKPRGVMFVNLRTLTETSSDEPGESTRNGRTIEESLRSKGIDLRTWSEAPSIVVLRPFVASGSTPEGLKLNSSREIDELMGQLASRGSLCVHAPEMLSLTPTSTGGDKSDSALDPVAVPITPPGRSNIRRYAQSLAAGDCSAIFEGGLIVPLGNEQVEREFARVFRSLPRSEFRSLETLQPIVVRSCRESRDTLIYLVNDASYSVETDLTFNCSSQAVLSNGTSGDRLTTHTVEQGLGTRLSLEPFQTLFLRLSGPDARVVQCDVLVPQAAERGLKVRFDRLKQAMDIMGSDASRTLDGLPPNGDFEELGEDRLPAHWSVEGDRAQLGSDSQILHGGSHSLRLTGTAGSSAISEFFTPPDGRALAMNVWLRTARPNTRVRWFLSGEHNNDTVYRCYADITVGTNWEAKQFRARDLPDRQIHRIQVKFQLLDEDSLWLDEARVCALPISQTEKLAISKSVSAIYKAWKERRWSDFERLYDGYWPTYLVETVEAAKGQ